MGCTGSGGLPPQANGTSEEFFRLVPHAATVRVVVPDAVQETDLYQQTRRIVASCENRQNQTFDYDGVGVAVSLNRFTHFPAAPILYNRVTYTMTQDAAWRDRNPVDLAAFLRDNANTTVVAVIDMDSGNHLDGAKGNSTVRQCMIDVIRAAQARNVPIFDVYCNGHPTHADLRAAIDARADAQAYANHRTFSKPGTGGACDVACTEVGVLPAVRFTTAIAGFANVVVMGFDASICVGKSVFGGWNVDRQNIQAEGQVDELRIRQSYEQGILDLGKNVITSWQVLVCGNAAGPLVNAYLKYQPD